MTVNEQQIKQKKIYLNWGERISKFWLAHSGLSFKGALSVTQVRSMQPLPQSGHPFPLVFTVPGFISLPSAWFCAISLANIHLGWMFQGRAAHCSLHGVPSEAHSSQMAPALDSSLPPAFWGASGSRSKPAFLAGFNYRSELDQRIDLCPLQRGSSKTRAAQPREVESSAVEPPHVCRDRVLSHQGSAILHAWIALQRPLGCHPVRPIYKSHNRFNFEISLFSLRPPPLFLPKWIYNESIWKGIIIYMSNSSTMPAACSSGVGYDQRKWAWSLKSAFIHVYILTKS